MTETIAKTADNGDVIEHGYLAKVIAFINEWREWGDIKEACDKFKVSRVTAHRMLRGKARPKGDFLRYLKEKAERNYNKVRMQQ